MKETDPMVALPPFPGGCAPALPADVTPKRSPDCPMGASRLQIRTACASSSRRQAEGDL